MNNENDDKGLFRSLFSGIERVNDERVPEWRKKPRAKPTKNPQTPDLDELAISPWPELEDNAAAGEHSDSFRANGVRDKLVRQLRRGQLVPQASIDLHGMTRSMALPELQAFIQACQSRSINCVRIIHGKGHLSDGGKAILKPSVAIWLQQIPSVLAYCPALSNDGGDGALYVLLKKG